MPATLECGCPMTFPEGLVFWATECAWCKAPVGQPCVYGPNSKYGTPGQPTKTPHGGRKDAHMATVHRATAGAPVTVSPDGKLLRGGVPSFSSPEEADAWLEQQAAAAGDAAESSQLVAQQLGVPRVPDVLLVSVVRPDGTVLWQGTLLPNAVMLYDDPAGRFSIHAAR